MQIRRGKTAQLLLHRALQVRDPVPGPSTQERQRHVQIAGRIDPRSLQDTTQLIEHVLGQVERDTEAQEQAHISHASKLAHRNRRLGFPTQPRTEVLRDRPDKR